MIIFYLRARREFIGDAILYEKRFRERNDAMLNILERGHAAVGWRSPLLLYSGFIYWRYDRFMPGIFDRSAFHDDAENNGERLEEVLHPRHI